MSELTDAQIMKVLRQRMKDALDNASIPPGDPLEAILDAQVSFVEATLSSNAAVLKMHFEELARSAGREERLYEGVANLFSEKLAQAHSPRPLAWALPASLSLNIFQFAAITVLAVLYSTSSNMSIQVQRPCERTGTEGSFNCHIAIEPAARIGP